MYEAMTDHSEHATRPLSELEVFIGYIINPRGVQTRRQRDRSEKLKDEFDRISAQTMERMRGNKAVPATGYIKELDALELCLACTHISHELGGKAEDAGFARPGRRRGYGGLRSFRLVAVLALLRELDHLEGEWAQDAPPPP